MTNLYPVEPDVLRYKLNKTMPYFADVIYRLRPKLVDAEDMPMGMKTFGVDKKFTWYYTAEVPWPTEEQVTILFHEINHLIRNHAGRCGDRDQMMWNIAGDREINDWFPPKMDVPGTQDKNAGNMIGSSKYGMQDLDMADGELAEFYYDRLDRHEVHAREDATAMHPGTGKCATHKGCDGKDTEPVLDKTGKATQKGVIHVPVCGGSAGNGDDEGEEGQGVGEIEAEAVRQSVAEKVLKESEMGRGNLPGGLVEWADKYMNPKVPWQKLLRTITRRASTIIAGDTKQTFTKPPRRSPPGIILPKKIATKTVCALYIDSSGSMSDEEIGQCVAEVKAALRTNLADLSVNFIDTEVYETIKAGNGSFKVPSKLKRGGTNMVKCWEHADKLRPRPNLVIVMTDGITPWPEDQPRDIRSIILMTKQYIGQEKHYPVPEWVFKTIQMEDL